MAVEAGGTTGSRDDIVRSVLKSTAACNDADMGVATHIELLDSFGALYKDINIVRWWYKELLAEIAASNFLYDVIKELTGEEIEVEKDEGVVEAIRSSNYALA